MCLKYKCVVCMIVDVVCIGCGLVIWTFTNGVVKNKIK